MTLPFMHKLAQLSPDRVVYISCNPYTQVIDIEPLKKAGYQIKKIVPVDLFGFTPHVETVVLMSRVEGKQPRKPSNTVVFRQSGKFDIRLDKHFSVTYPK